MFLNLFMLAGLGAVVVPLVLHLLARSRSRDVRWGAMMFLNSADTSAASSRLKQWMLLGLRMGMIVLFALALARPVMRERFAPIAPESRSTAVIVLDCSMSMHTQEAGRSRFDRAKDAALQILSNFGPGDEVALVLLGEEIDTRQPSPNLQMIARDISELSVTAGRADVAGGLKAARQMLQNPGLSNRELYLLCDRQAVGWRDAADLADFRQWIGDARHPTQFFVIPVGGESPEYLTVDSIELQEGVAVKGQPAEVVVSVRNHAPTVRGGIELELSMMRPGDGNRPASDRGRRISSTPLTLPADGTVTVRVPVTFDLVGSHVLTATIRSATPLPTSRFDRAIEVLKPIEVLIVSGDEASTPIGRESFFLRLALAPFRTAAGQNGDPAVATVLPADQISAAKLDDFAVIILANVPQLSAEQARVIEQRIYEGAGLILAPGNLTRVDNFNAILHRGGAGLSPASLDWPTVTEGGRATSILGVELNHPIFRFRRGADPLPAAVVGRYFPVMLNEAESRVLGSYASGAPFLIEADRGRGHVLLITTPLDADWSTLPLTPFYLPFVQSMVRYVGRPPTVWRNLECGESIIATFEQAPDDLQLYRYDQRLPLSSRSAQLRYDALRPGIYRLSAKLGGHGIVQHFVVRPPREELDLTSLSSQQWQDYAGQLGFELLQAGERPLADLLARQRRGRELWLPLLCAVALLGLIELWLARRWTREVA